MPTAETLFPVCMSVCETARFRCLLLDINGNEIHDNHPPLDTGPNRYLIIFYGFQFLFHKVPLEWEFRCEFRGSGLVSAAFGSVNWFTNKIVS